MIAMWKDTEDLTGTVGVIRKRFEEKISLHEVFLESVPQTLILTYIFVISKNEREEEFTSLLRFDIRENLQHKK